MEKSFYSKVFLWLFIGLLVTFGSGAIVMNSYTLMSMIFSNSMYIVIFLLQLGLCIFLTARIHKMSPTTAKITYLGYSFLTGVTFSALFLLFSLSSIIFVFLVTAILFGLFALIGKFTNIDLTKFGVYLFIGLIGIIILEIINIFLMNNTLDMVTCIISIVIFLGYTAWDMQRIKSLAESNNGSENMAIFGAFELYLDFINLFIDLLRLLGKSRD